MTSVALTEDKPRGAALALGFATVVAMWTIGYIARLPGVEAPGWLVLALMLVIMTAGGVAAGRLTERGVASGALAGLVAAAVNLLVLAGVVDFDGGGRAPGAAVWIPGALVFGTAWGACSAALARAVAGGPRERRRIDWTQVLAGTAAVATFILVVLGGLVTSFGAGLAVPDWPNTFGTAMFLYPLSKMTGGIYYEHAHRLFGSLVGLSVIALTVQVFVAGRRWGPRALSLAALALVVVQGILGGLRVTGSFTTSAAPEDLAPSLTLAVVHGVSGQLFFAVVVAIAALTSPAWRLGRIELRAPVGGGLRIGGAALPLLLVVQLVLGALVRHRATGVMAHIGASVVVAMAAVLVGTLFWAAVRAPRSLPRLGLALIWITGLQIALGFAAFVVTGGGAGEPSSTWPAVIVRTAHQTNGALMLAAAIAVALWALRRDLPQPVPETGAEF